MNLLVFGLTSFVAVVWMLVIGIILFAGNDLGPNCENCDCSKSDGNEQRDNREQFCSLLDERTRL